MNLAWLAAVLQPHDVAPHLNFGDPEYDFKPAPRLAALVVGQAWRHEMRQMAKDDPPPELIVMAQRCLQPDTIATGVEELASRLIREPPTDAAEAAALTLLTCAAASELDDYDTCMAVLDSELGRSFNEAHPDDVLVRAALLQQKALRLLDSGQPHVELCLEVGRLLANLDATKCSQFEMGRGVSWECAGTLAGLRAGLLDAARSLVPFEHDEAATEAGLPNRFDMVRAPATELDIWLARDRAQEYSRHVAQLFREEFRSESRTLGGGGAPDLFQSLLWCELMGDGRVYHLRRDLAQLRLVRSENEPSETADALRLLRHAAAKNELDLVLRRLRLAGPLSVLNKDARQVLRTRTSPNLLRTVELQVLRMSADVLAPAEARLALQASFDVLRAGGPPNLPLQWQLEVLRQEIAWVAAAALARVSNQSQEVAATLFTELERLPAGDQLYDTALARAVYEVEWPDVPRSLQSRWAAYLNAAGNAFEATREAFAAVAQEAVELPPESSPIDRAVYLLNVSLKGGEVDDADIRQAVPLLRQALTATREEAGRGHRSFGGVSEGDVAAGIILTGRADDLWRPLTDFLLDPLVSRHHRTPALNRLARSDAQLPPEVADRFRDRGTHLLTDVGYEPFDRPVTPYPAALRFLASHRLLPDSEVFDAVAVLAGKADPPARTEAALTVALLAAQAPRSELLVLALTLATDHDVEVRANAGRALAILAAPELPLAAVALRRLAELLAQDGLLAPLRVLRGLRDVSRALPEAIQEQIRDMVENHPSWSVRSEAKRVLGG